jgi:hypothetical protein
MIYVLGPIAFVIYFVLLVMAGGHTLSTLWNDFIPGIFPSLPTLNFYQALAVSLVVGLFSGTSSAPFNKDPEDQETWRIFANALAPFLRYGIALLMGMWLKTHL